MDTKCLAAALCCLAFLTSAADAEVFNIPDGDYSALRDAVRQAEGNGEADTILLAPAGSYSPVDSLAIGTITTPITIHGRGAAVNGDQPGDGRMVTVGAQGRLTISDLTILNVSHAINESNYSGGVINNRGTARLRNVTITGTNIDATQNSVSGAVLANSGTLDLENVTLSENFADGEVFGVALENSGTANLINVTIADNRFSSGSRVAIDTSNGESLSIGNSILGGNDGNNCNGSADSIGGNVSDDTSCGLNRASDQSSTDPMLEPLADNGGGILTQSPADGSPAVDAGIARTCTPMDARGLPRPQAGASGAGRSCDAGAQEVSGTRFDLRPPSTGSWFDPSQSGHGIMLEFLPDGQILVTWFVFDNAGNRDWVQAIGHFNDEIAKLSAYQVDGGQFPPAFNSGATDLVYWGTLSIVLYGCDSGAMTWMPDRQGYRAGGMPLARLSSIAGQTCP